MEFEQKHIDNFWSKVIKMDGCWLWKAAHCRDGYGLYSIKINGIGKQYKAHRFVKLIQGESIPPGYVVLHSCDNPGCVNPDHLRIGTVQENNLDKLAKNRQVGPKGQKNSKSKLTDQQVRDIKKRAQVGHRVGYNNGSNLKQLAKEYGTCIDTIRLIARNKTWRHIDAVE